MSTEPFIGEIKIFGFNFAPQNYQLCNGQIVSISQNTALFSLLGTTYGGNGQTTFALPDLRGRMPIGQGQGSGLPDYMMGEVSGTTNTTLTTANLPAHTPWNRTYNKHSDFDWRTRYCISRRGISCRYGCRNIFKFIYCW